MYRLLLFFRVLLLFLHGGVVQLAQQEYPFDAPTDDLAAALDHVLLTFRQSPMLDSAELGVLEESLRAASACIPSVLPERTTQSEEQERLDELLNWFHQSGGETLAGLEIQLDERTNERGWYYSKAGDASSSVQVLQPNTTLMRIPDDLILRPMPPDGNLSSNLSSSTRLAVRLIQEMRQGTHSKWLPYLKTLPPVDRLQTHCLLWPWQSVDPLLVTANPAAHQEAWQARRGTLLSYVMTWSLTGCSWTDWQYAVTVVRNRQNSADGTEVFLLPLWDMANHDTDAATELLMTTPAGGFLWKTTANSLYPGDQVTMTYSQSRPLHHYALYQGFVPAVPPAVATLLTYSDPATSSERQRLAKANSVASLGTDETIWNIEWIRTINKNNDAEEEQACLFNTTSCSSTEDIVIPAGLILHCAYMWEDMAVLKEIIARYKDNMDEQAARLAASNRTNQLLMHIFDTIIEDMKLQDTTTTNIVSNELRKLVTDWRAAELLVFEKAAQHIQSLRSKKEERDAAA